MTMFLAPFLALLTIAMLILCGIRLELDFRRTRRLTKLSPDLTRPQPRRAGFAL
jgi:hypothetical protein